jgi:hypothetical protein
MMTGDEIAIGADYKSRTGNSLSIRIEDFDHRFSETIETVITHGKNIILGSN